MKRLTNRFAVLAGAAALAGVPAATAQNPNAARRQIENNIANRLTPSDTAFAEKAAQGGLAEVKLGTLAEERAESPDVKGFGKRMVEDHTKANQELMKIAGQSGVTLPSTLTAKDEEEYDRLSKLSGAAFDHAYISHMISDHRADIAEFRHEANNGMDPELKAFAAKYLPVLEEHLRLAEAAGKDIKGETK